MVTQKAICCTENYYPSEASSRQSSLPGRVGRRSGLDWSGIHRLVAAVESACRRGSYWRGACMCLDEKPAPILKSFAQAWHSWRNTPEASRAREISQQKEPGQIRLSKQIWDLEQRQGRGQWIADCEVADVEHWLSPHLATPQKWNFAMGSCTWSARLFIAMHLQQPFNKRRESTEEQPFNKSR